MTRGEFGHAMNIALIDPGGLLVAGVTTMPERVFKILIVDDDNLVVIALRQMVKQFGEVRFATGGEEALAIAARWMPDLVLLDVEMPGLNGLQTCTAFKRDEQLRHIPIIFVTGRDSPDDEVAGLAAGADDFIAKPPRPGQVAARVRVRLELKQAQDELRESARTDRLTRAANRLFFDEQFQREWAQSNRTGRELSLLIFDIDHFKEYNDRYGHAAGDDCLRSFVEMLRLAVQRPTDLLARYGGEEFAALLPDTPAAGARCVASRALDVVERARLRHEGAGFGGYLTCSVGVSTFVPDSRERTDGATDAMLQSMLFEAADRALYVAKRHGRAQARFLEMGEIEHVDRAELIVRRPIAELSSA